MISLRHQGTFSMCLLPGKTNVMHALVINFKHTEIIIYLILIALFTFPGERCTLTVVL